MKFYTKKLIIITTAILCSCSHTSTNKRIKAKGDAYYGGTFRINESRYFRTLFPINISETVSNRIVEQIYEGLVKLNQNDLTIKPALAETWERNADASQWTFHIRKGVKFHNDSCFKNFTSRELVANDIKFCFEKLCTASEGNKHFGITFKDRVLGANEYFESTSKKSPLYNGVSGIRVIDDYTIQINLEYPFAGFLNILATSACFIYPPEAYEKYGTAMKNKCVGTGPFQLNKAIENKSLVLIRNPNYWQKDESGNQLPFLDSVVYSFISDKKTELSEFKKQNLEMVFQLPTDLSKSVMEEIENAPKNSAPFEMQVVPSMTTYYYGFLNANSVFSKKEIRLAFNYAIDREQLVTKVLNGDGIPGIYGIVPPSIKYYDSKSINGFYYDVEKAKKYLEQAGYPNGRGFPKIKLIVDKGNERNTKVADEVKRMLKENLNVEIDVALLPFDEFLEMRETGKAEMWKTGWNADYPDPESFLNQLYSKNIPKVVTEKSYLNAMHFSNKKFDELFSAAMQEININKRMELYHDADQIAIDEGAIMPIFYDENYRLLQPYVKNFPANAMEYRDLSEVYLVPLDNNNEEK